MASPRKIKEFCDNPDVDPGLDPYTSEFIVRIATYVISTAKDGSPHTSRSPTYTLTKPRKA